MRASPENNDLYQFTMAFGYFLAGKHQQPATFDCYFRKPPFKGHYAIAAGLRDILSLLEYFKFSQDFIACLQRVMPSFTPAFLNYLSKLDCSSVQVEAVREGDLVFPCQPIVKITGPLLILQLLETPILNLVGYASLVATNANRIVRAAKGSTCYELGLRRAQGPDGGLSASEYSYLGGFNGSSNTNAALKFQVPCVGTTAHAFITSFKTLQETPEVVYNGVDIRQKAIEARKKINLKHGHDGELAAFIAFVKVKADPYMNLLDTYSTLLSGMPNFICVALALIQAGVTHFSARLDSGDLCELSIQTKKMWQQHVGSKATFTIFASNDLHEDEIARLVKAGAQIDSFGVGTNLSTCAKQPSLGIVYKLVQINKEPVLKLSEDASKVMLAGNKAVYRVWTEADQFVSCDVLSLVQESFQPGKPMFLMTFKGEKVELVPSKIRKVLSYIWTKDNKGEMDTLQKARQFCNGVTKQFRREVFEKEGQGQHKVLLSEKLFKLQEQLKSKLSMT